ncbi:MAG: 3-oxoacyl-[acyl-carrier-protein] synthase III C-terminal domain-containing protein [Bauldia sp.]
MKIIGVGRYLPERVVTSSEVERLCGIKPGWIERHTGVKERRWVNSRESNSYMGAAAAREAIKDAGLTLEDIDLILCAAGTPEQTIPDNSALLQRELGLGKSGTSCMSVHITCLSFLLAMDLASVMLSVDRYKNILIVASDIASVALNFKDPESAALFGDAAAAVVVTKTPPGEESKVQRARFETYSVGAHLTEIRGGGSRRHPANPDTRPEDNLFSMAGPKVYRLARQHQDEFLERLRPGLSRGPGSIKVVLPHQASLLALRALRRNGIDDEQVVITLDRFGNCVATSLPLTLYEAVKTNRLNRGDEILLAGTGAGLTLGGMILTY